MPAKHSYRGNLKPFFFIKDHVHQVAIGKPKETSNFPIEKYPKNKIPDPKINVFSKAPYIARDVVPFCVPRELFLARSRIHISFCSNESNARKGLIIYFRRGVEWGEICVLQKLVHWGCHMSVWVILTAREENSVFWIKSTFPSVYKIPQALAKIPAHMIIEIGGLRALVWS